MRYLIVISLLFLISCEASTKVDPSKVTLETKDGHTTKIKLPDQSVEKNLEGIPIIEITVEEKVYKVPAGSEITIEKIKSNKGDASSIGLHTKGKDVEQKFDVQPPKIVMGNEPIASGGSLGFSGVFKSQSDGIIFYTMGGIIFVAGLIIFAVISKPVGFSFMLGGAAWAAVGLVFQEYPWAVLMALAITVMAGLYFLYDARRNKNKGKALEAVVEGVEAANGAADAVKEKIAEKDTDGTVKREVRKIKDKKKL